MSGETAVQVVSNAAAIGKASIGALSGATLAGGAIISGTIIIGGYVYYVNSNKRIEEKIASDERITNEKIASDERITKEKIASAERIEKAKISSDVDKILKEKQLEVMTTKLEKIVLDLKCNPGTQPIVKIGTNGLPEATCMSVITHAQKDRMDLEYDCTMKLHNICKNQDPNDLANMSCGILDCTSNVFSPNTAFLDSALLPLGESHLEYSSTSSHA